MIDRRFSARALEVFASAGLPKGLTVNAAKAADQPAEILLYDEIGPWGVTAKDFMGAMAQAGAGPLKVRINSPGGDVFDGMAIHNALANHTGGVTCVVDGLAASAASYIALAGDNLEMAENAMYMIHRAWGVAVGNTNDMTTTAALLAKVDGQLVGMYAKKTGGDPADVMTALDAETWYTAAEAKAAGYCDTITAPPARAARAARAAFTETPAAQAVETPVAADPSDDTAAARRKIEMRLRIAMAE